MLFSKLVSLPLGLALVVSSVALNGTDDEIVPYALPGLIDDEEETYVDPEDDKSYFRRDNFANAFPSGAPSRTVKPFDLHTVICGKGYGTSAKYAEHNRELPSYNYIADGIQVVLNECNTKGGISGEIDHPDHWRANVHHMYNRNGKQVQ
ncbi:hypothetical protein BJX62DRAFT_239343 [Aspergillus germanicus]